jgi:hypothetical protein
MFAYFRDSTLEDHVLGRHGASQAQHNSFRVVGNSSLIGL